MSDCLFTKLKATVNNSLLPKIGEVVISINASTSDSTGFAFSSNGQVKVRVSEGGRFKTATDGEWLTEYTYSSGGGSSTSPNKVFVDYTKDFRLFISNASAITRIVRAESKAPACIIDAKDLKKFVSITDYSMAFKIKDYQKGSEAFKSFATILPLLKITNFINNSQADTLAYEDFIGICNNSGKSSPTNGIYIYNFFKYFTLCGNTYSPATNNAYITFTSSSKYAAYYSSTSIAQAAGVYVKGYSAEEIAALQTAGKVVYNAETGELYTT